MRTSVTTAALATVASLAAVAGPAGASGPGPASTAARRCPASAARAPFRHDVAARRRLVPGHPKGLILCRYAGLNVADPLGLNRSRTVHGPHRVRRLGHRFNLLKPFPPGRGVCRADFGGQILARFRYPRATDDHVAVDLSGCRSVTNGPRTRASHGRRGSRLVRTLRRLTG
jgi:hypothetical protein